MTDAMGIPNFVTHYFRTSKKPFLNLSALSREEVQLVMRAMIAERRDGLQHRPFGAKYMKMRHLAEDRLRQKFIDLGGQPERQHPHYFVLGESPWFKSLAEDMAEIRLPIDVLPSAQTTVTWGDSFAAMEVTSEFGLIFEPKPYYGTVFRLEEIQELAARYGIPRPMPDGYEGLPTGDTPEAFIELQLWSDNPVREYLALDT